MNDTKNRVQVYFKSINSGDKKCINCSKCVDSHRPEFAKCGAMYLKEGKYTPVTDFNYFTGFHGIIYGAYISLLIQNNIFPNAEGNCQYYKKIWHKFWIK